MVDSKIIKNDMKRNLSDFRYQHTIRVMLEAKKLAERYQISKEKVIVAALLHDIAKEFSQIENERWIEKYKLSTELLKEEYRNIIHADIGAEVAKEKYSIDQDIYNAIKYHTIGNKNMDTLAKVIFIADKIGRKELSLQLIKIKKVSYQDLNQAIRLIIALEKEKLQKYNLSLHKNTIELLNSLSKEEKLERDTHPF